MNVINMPTGDLIPYENNTKIHPPEQVEHIANSIKRFGWQQPIVIDKNNVVIIGHGRLLAAKQMGLQEVPVVYADDLSEEDAQALRLADNKLNESPWDFGKLEQELAELNIAGIDMTQFGFDDIQLSGSDENPYTGKVNIPQYDPTGEHEAISDLVDTSKTDELIAEIEESELEENEKEFLKLAAQRHLAFNYKKIANYYADASPEMQEFMERSALVIIDYENAIANGYTRLNDSVKEMFDDVEE